ncbi:MAG: histidine--tRNA ligase [Candidatus Nanoarchaeia archaeon]
MFTNPKGTVDFFPEDKAVQKYIFDKFRKVADSYNFKEIETPAFEDLKLLTEKGGEEIKSQIFLMEQRGREKFGLRFDMTVPAVRMFLAKQKSLPKPVQWYYLTRMWRYERPQKGRMREFYQFGVECMGSSDPAADAQVIQIAIDALKSLGLTHEDFFVRLNNRKLLQGMLANLVDEEYFGAAVAIIDKREKITENEFFRLLKEVHVKDPSKIVELVEICDMKALSKLKLNDLGKEGLAELKEVYSLVDKDYVRISLDTVRGLAYYTGTVFEIFDTGNKYRSICGGGRYDKMVGMFGGQSTPATGFGMGYSILTLLLKDKGLLPKVKMGPKFYIACVSDTVKTDAMHIAMELRKKNIVESGLGSRSLGKQFAYADSIGSDYVVIVGEKDLKKKQVTVRDMIKGDEQIVKLKDLSKL